MMKTSRVYESAVGQFVNDLKVGSAAWLDGQVMRFESKRRAEVEEAWKQTLSMYEEERGYTRKRPKGQQTVLGEYIQPPRVYGIAQSIVSVLYNRMPKFFCSPITARQEMIARFIEAAINNQWQLNPRWNKQCKMALLDGTLYGMGILFTEYRSNKKPEVLARERREAQKYARQLMADPTVQAQLEPLFTEVNKSQDAVTMPERMATYELDSNSVFNQVCVRRVSPFQFIIDPDSRGLDDCRWVGRVIDVDVRELKKDPLYKNTKNITGTTTVRNPEPGARSSMNGATPIPIAVGRSEITNPSGQMKAVSATEATYATIAEVFIRNTDEDGNETWDFKVLTRDNPDFIQEQDAKYDLGHPYTVYAPNATGERLFPQSDIDPAMTHILEEREVRTRLYEWMMRNANDMYGVDVQAVGGNFETFISSMRRTKVGTFIPIQSASNRPVRDVVFQFPRTVMTPEVMNYLALIQRDIELATGLGPNQQMMAMKSETSATEAAEVAGWARARNQPKAYEWEACIADVGMKIAQQHAQFSPVKDIMQLAGPKAAAEWAKQEWTRGDIQSGLMVTVERGSMQPESDQKRQALYGQLLTMMLQNPVLAAIGDAPQIARRLIEAMGVQDGSELIRNVDPEQFGQALQQYQQVAGGGGSAPAGPPTPSSPAEGAQQGAF